MTQKTRHASNLEALGQFIRERRRALRLTQTQLGARLGWVQERISVLEHGKYGTPSLPLLASLAEALEVSQAELLSAAGFLQESPVFADAIHCGRTVRTVASSLSAPSLSAAPKVDRHPAGSAVGAAPSGGPPRPPSQSSQLLGAVERLQDQVAEAEERVQTVEELSARLVESREALKARTRDLTTIYSPEPPAGGSGALPSSSGASAPRP
jgi:transcriptional regulator with XRE-family HTH domain